MTQTQTSLWNEASFEHVETENPAYLKKQLLTYLGNKRSLLRTIAKGMEIVRRRLGGRPISALDAFAGSGVVSRFLKQYCDRLVSNDFEKYAYVVGSCYLTNEAELDVDDLRVWHKNICQSAEDAPIHAGLIRTLYAPKDESRITEHDRVFYTIKNAIRLDSLRNAINAAPADLQKFFLGPLLVEASVHANTSGVFKGFYKDSETGIGCFGGKAGNALKRIRGAISLPFPVWSRFQCDVSVRQEDVRDLIREDEIFDVAYFDPPYNQHPYGSNYFMLNLLVDYVPPTNLSRVSGIPADWKRSLFNKRKDALAALTDTLEFCNARFCLISYSDEGFVTRPEFDELLNRLGKVHVIETPHNTFRGCRNLRNRATHVTEQLFILEKNN